VVAFAALFSSAKVKFTESANQRGKAMAHTQFNPGHNNERRNRRQALVFSALYIVGSLVLLFGLEFGVLTLFHPNEAPYSQFLAAVENGDVTRVAIGDTRVLWSTRAGAQFVSQRIPGAQDTDLITELKNKGIEFTGFRESNPLGDLLSWLAPIALLAALWWFAMPRLPGMTQALTIGRSRAKIWDQGSVRITFQDVAGVDQAVEELREIVDFLKNPLKYSRLGGRIPKGVLLVGPPGTGKTLLARATAGEAGVPFFSLSGAEFVEMFVGVGAARVRDLFQQAKEKAPCIVFIDELDTIGRTRGGASMVTHEEREQTLNQLLVEMDGFDSSAGVIIMAATNRPDVLDPALMRPGRFDRQIVVDKPDLAGREAILRVHARGVVLAPDVDLHVIAARTPGFAGAELANVINEAALLAARHEREAVTLADLDEAVERVMIGLAHKNRALNTREQERVACHEMGHALVASLLPGADPVHKVSMVPRGAAALGMTTQLPLEDRYLLTEQELRDRMAVLMGGRAAEEIIFGDVSTGAQNDLQQATDLARRMVREFGMSALGPIAFSNGHPPFLERALPSEYAPRAYSERTAEAIDEQVRMVVEASYQRAKQLLQTHRALLEELAQELRRVEVMDGKVLEQRLREAGISRAAARAR
jgi:cell division protease FtsH